MKLRRRRKTGDRENRHLESRLDELVARGLLTRTSRKKLSAFRPIRIAGRPLSETILEDREDRF
jgi:hypothetical protein